MFLTRENDIFAFQNIAITRRETSRKEIWSILSAVLQLRYVRSIKLHSIKTVDCGLRTADCGLRTVDNGFRSTPPWKNSSAHIVIFQSFLKFAAAKREISNSSSLPLTPPYCKAWPLGGWGTWGWGGIPFESDRNVRRFPKGRNSTFWVFNIFNHKGIAYGCA